MPPKKGGGSKALEALARVNAFMTTYKVSARTPGIRKGPYLGHAGPLLDL